MKRLLPLLLVLLWGQNILWAQKAVLVRTQYESYATDNETDSLLPERKESREYYTFLRFNRRKDTLFVHKKDTPKDIAQKDAFSYFLTTKKIASDKLQLLIGDRDNTHTFLFYLESPDLIHINKDRYVLSDEYSHFLRKKIFKKRDIATILDFLDDQFGDYFIDTEVFMISTKDKYKKNLKMYGGTVLNEADTTVYSTLYAAYDDKGLRMSGKVNTNVPELPFSLDKKRKYIDADKLVLEIEGQTPKNNTTYTQEIYFSGEKFIEKGEYTQYGLNITTFYTETIEKIKNERCRK
ncbi:hypothetical protein [Capnocytophaga gingivalis]|uniref:hypothetical protein n=1 Tax=Capnocytophaga gingivalis TaxID=1017 RepID=UPI00019FB20C|nr:hypothetical protein [Capnocytophaga gingivalis]EEK13998.1 hypothetical protein CAPGI0001_0149 [Capnocytophaga gingivalis ATCC 33624]MEB3014620.1 hypothetical protein [Capnocytophaga gingivalis]